MIVREPLGDGIATREVVLFGWRAVWKPRPPPRGRFVGDFPSISFENGSPTMGNGVVPSKWFSDFALEDVPMGNARRGEHLPKIFEGGDNILRERKPCKGIGPDEFFVLKEVRATVWGSA